MRLSFFLYLLTFCRISLAQDTVSNNTKTVIIQAPKIDSSIIEAVIDSHKLVLGLVEVKNEKIDLLIEDYKAHKKYFGYRIQIFSSSNNRLEAVRAKSEFLRKFSQINSYLVYQAPNYKVRVGDFLDRLEAKKELLLIKESFPNAFLVKGEIEPKIE